MQIMACEKHLLLFEYMCHTHAAASYVSFIDNVQKCEKQFLINYQ